MSAASESCSGLVAGLLSMVVGIVAIAVAGGAYGGIANANNQIATLNQTVVTLNETSNQLAQEVMDLETAISRLPMFSDNTTWTKIGTGLCSAFNNPPIPGDPTYSLYQATYHGLSAIFLVIEAPISDTSSFSEIFCAPQGGYFDNTWVPTRLSAYTPEQLQSVSCTDPDCVPQYNTVFNAANYRTLTSGGNVLFQTQFYPFNDGVDTYTFAANMTFPLTYTYGAPSPPGGKKKKMRTISLPRRRRPDFKRIRGVHKRKLH